MALSARTISEDRRLDRAVNAGQEELARHRWHWTLDESNPKRVPIREYARAVGRNESTIRRWVTAYTEWQGAADSGRTLAECFERAKLGDDTLVAAEAVARARGITPKTARQLHNDEVRQVKATAQERVERSATATSYEEQAHEVAQFRAKVRQSDASSRQRDKDRHTMRYLEIEGDLASARRYLLHALKTAEDVAFSDEERDLLQHTIGEIKALLNLLDMRAVGETHVDWDAEMAKLSGGQS